MTTRLERRDPGATTTGRSSSNLRGTWTIDPAHSSIAFTWRALRLWTVTGRRHCLGVIHLDELPPIGVIRFRQPSGLPVLTMALDPASLETRDLDLNAMLSGPDFGAVRRQRWWTLHSQSLEVLPSGAWRLMAALIAHGSQGLVELRLEIDPEQSRSDWLVLRGWGVLDRRAFGIGRGAACQLRSGTAGGFRSGIDGRQRAFPIDLQGGSGIVTLAIELKGLPSTERMSRDVVEA